MWPACHSFEWCWTRKIVFGYLTFKMTFGKFLSVLQPFRLVEWANSSWMITKGYFCKVFQFLNGTQDACLFSKKIWIYFNVYSYLSHLARWDISAASFCFCVTCHFRPHIFGLLTVLWPHWETFTWRWNIFIAKKGTITKEPSIPRDQIWSHLLKCKMMKQVCHFRVGLPFHFLTENGNEFT
jgi:hypothetical protein